VTAAELARLIGTRRAWHVTPAVWVEVDVLDARHVFGRTDVRVRPVAGDGSQWVDLARTGEFVGRLD